MNAFAGKQIKNNAVEIQPLPSCTSS